MTSWTEWGQERQLEKTTLVLSWKQGILFYVWGLEKVHRCRCVNGIPNKAPCERNALFGSLMKSLKELKEDKRRWADLWVDRASLKINELTDREDGNERSSPSRTQEGSEVFLPPGGTPKAKHLSKQVLRHWDEWRNTLTTEMTENQRGQQRGKIIDDFPNCFQGRGAPKPGSDDLKVEDTKVKQELRLFYVSEYSSVSTNRLRKWLITFKSWRLKAPLFALEYLSPPMHIQMQGWSTFHSLTHSFSHCRMQQGYPFFPGSYKASHQPGEKPGSGRLARASGLPSGWRGASPLPRAAVPPTVRVCWDLWAPAAPAPPAAAAAGYSRRAEWSHPPPEQRTPCEPRGETLRSGSQATASASCIRHTLPPCVKADRLWTILHTGGIAGLSNKREETDRLCLQGVLALCAPLSPRLFGQLHLTVWVSHPLHLPYQYCSFR